MIQITEKLRIVKADDKNLALEELRDVTNKKTQTTNKQWCWCGYYGSIRSALLGCMDKLLIDSAEDNITVKDLISKIDNIKEQIEKANYKE